MFTDKMVAPPNISAGIGVFCHVNLHQPNSDDSQGYYVWIGVRSQNAETAIIRAKAFLETKDADTVEIEDTVVLDEEDFKNPDTVQQLGGRIFHGRPL